MKTDACRFQIVDTALGPAAVVGGKEGLKSVVLPGLAKKALRREVRRRFPGCREEPRGLARARGTLERYFTSGRLPRGGVKLDLSDVGAFRGAVYAELMKIPAGETVTYAELARRIGKPGAHRSVGTALSRNPLPVFVPCHRVLRSDGGLGGFTAEGGLALKEAMLRLEGALEPSPG
ncbi:MAG: methylated-DNA--[protein]-cysteine S-methyltransferase [Planctomycetota bacterium]|jgi:methylated-DNA-[protein]-cysteine S-methyltransferase